MLQMGRYQTQRIAEDRYRVLWLFLPRNQTFDDPCSEPIACLDGEACGLHMREGPSRQSVFAARRRELHQTLDPEDREDVAADMVDEDQTPARPEDPLHLQHRSSLVRDRAHRVGSENGVELLVRERKSLSVTFEESDGTPRSMDR